MRKGSSKNQILSLSLCVCLPCIDVSDPLRNHVCISVTTHLMQNVRELPQLAQLNQVKPCYVQDPLCSFGWTDLQVQRSTSWGTSRKQLTFSASSLLFIMMFYLFVCFPACLFIQYITAYVVDYVQNGISADLIYNIIIIFVLLCETVRLCRSI